MRAVAALLLGVACAAPAPAPDPQPAPPVAPPPSTVRGAVEVPPVAFRLPEREGRTPSPLAASEEITVARAILRGVLEAHALDPENPWAVGHAILALGPDLTLTNGEPAVPWLVGEYAQPVAIGGETLLRFPAVRGAIRIEPHPDLLLKTFASAGLSPDLPVTVAGAPHTLGDLYRGSLARARVPAPGAPSSVWNDTPWALQAFATWAPADLAWTVAGVPTTLDGYTHGVVDRLASEYGFIRDALATGGTFEKRGQGIFAYTCGGAHLLQGAAYAVARGFGEEGDRATVQAQIPGFFARLDVELAAVDGALRQHPDYTVVLLVQRMKFLGHFLETGHGLAALGLYTPDDAQRAALERAGGQLHATVAVIDSAGLFKRLDAVRKQDEQLYLDLVGDAAHALRGLDLATGAATVAY